MTTASQSQVLVLRAGNLHASIEQLVLWSAYTHRRRRASPPGFADSILSRERTSHQAFTTGHSSTEQRIAQTRERGCEPQLGAQYGQRRKQRWRAHVHEGPGEVYVKAAYHAYATSVCTNTSAQFTSRPSMSPTQEDRRCYEYHRMHSQQADTARRKTWETTHRWTMYKILTA